MEEEDQTEDQSIALEESTDKLDERAGTITGYLTELFNNAEDDRYDDEERWLKAYRNYRGRYGPDVQFTEAEKSRIFVKVTKTKVLAAYGQIIDVIFGSNRFPLSIEPTKIPEGIAGTVHLDMNPQPGQPPQVEVEKESTELKPGETYQEYRTRLGPLEEKLSQVEGDLKQGPSTTPDQIEYHPALVSAKQMEKKILDGLEETNARKKLRGVVFEMCLLGHGILKGPFVTTKEYVNWKEDGEYEPLNVTRPELSHVRVWDFYPDPDAHNIEECEFVFERHKMSRSQLRKLKKRPHFRGEQIDNVIAAGENYVEKWWESLLEDNDVDSHPNRFEVLEFWGNIDVEKLQNHDVAIPKDLESEDEVSANIWMCGSEIIRLVINPFKPVRLPYHSAPYEVNPYSFFGVGVAENLEDTQLLMNGFMRMAVDNAALSGNLVFEIDETNLVPGQDMTLYPGKQFRREGGQPGQTIHGIKFPNTANENMMLFDKARVLADESTGLPSFAHGQTGVQGIGRTSSGISMLMNAAHGSIKTVIKNLDDYLIAPMGRSMYYFMNQFDFSKETAGDFEVVARGTESLMSNEIRSQRLMQFMQITSNPMDAPFAKREYLLREIAKSMDLDPDKVVNSQTDAMLRAKLMQAIQAQQTPPEQQPGGPEQVPNVQDTSGTGGGNMGIGSSPGPQEQGFTGTPGGEG